MKNKIVYLIFALCFFFFESSKTAAQVTLQVGGGVGVAIPTSDYSGNTIDYYAGRNYGLASGFSWHAKARVSIPSFSLYGVVDYSTFSNNGESEPGQGKVEVSQNIISLRVGPEYAIDIPFFPLTPYFGGNLALNFFSGETVFNGVSKVPSGTFSLEPPTRFGLGLNGGILVAISPLMNIDVGVSYNFNNLFGKEYVSIDATNDKDKRIYAYRNLNDEKDPNFVSITDDEHFIGEERSISSLQITATIMFGL